MNWPTPFAYPFQPHQRKHGPAGYAHYEEYKPWLRDEFTFRCVYCLERELWYPDRAASFSVDHIESQSEAPVRTCDYLNLVYACTRCNSSKRAVRLIDPTLVAFGKHLRVDEGGIVHAVEVDGKASQEGEFLIRLLHLNENPALETRRFRLDVLALKRAYPTDERVNRLFIQSFAYPSFEDLPDLQSLRPPGGNSLAENVRSCYRARRRESSLEDVY